MYYVNFKCQFNASSWAITAKVLYDSFNPHIGDFLINLKELKKEKNDKKY